jgi:hypothetical protein
MPGGSLARLFVVAHRACLELLFAISIASLSQWDFTVSAVHRSLDQGGALRPSISLPEEVPGPIGDAVIDELVRRGLSAGLVRRPAPADRSLFRGYRGRG